MFPVERLDAFLLWAAKRGASDISFQTGAPAFIEVDGRLARATGAALDGVALGSLCARIFDATGEGILRGGRAIDCSHAVAEARGVFRRFRCNLAPVQAAGGFAVNITLRVLPGAAELRGTRHRGRDRRGLGSAARPDPGDRGAGLGQVNPARRRHAAAAGARRRAHPVLRGAYRIRVRSYRRERRADVVLRDPPSFPKFCRRPAFFPAPPSRRGDRRRGARPRNRRGRGPGRRLWHRSLFHGPHHRRRRHHPPPAGGVPGRRACRARRRADRRHEPRGHPGAGAEPGRIGPKHFGTKRAHGATRMAGLRRPPQGRTAGAAANRLAGADRGRARGDRQQSCRCGRARLRRGPDRTGRAPALPRACRWRRWRRRQRRPGWGLRARSPIRGIPAHVEETIPWTLPKCPGATPCARCGST